MKLRYFPDSVLTKVAKPVPYIDGAIRGLTRDMLRIMKANGGIGLAAPQIGVSKRILVAHVDNKDYVFINPEIAYASDENELGREGCLSFPGLFINVERSLDVTVLYDDLYNGGKAQLVTHGLLARVLQHEIDHLDGILFTDRSNNGRTS